MAWGSIGQSDIEVSSQNKLSGTKRTPSPPRLLPEAGCSLLSPFASLSITDSTHLSLRDHQWRSYFGRATTERLSFLASLVRRGKERKGRRGCEGRRAESSSLQLVGEETVTAI